MELDPRLFLVLKQNKYNADQEVSKLYSRVNLLVREERKKLKHIQKLQQNVIQLQEKRSRNFSMSQEREQVDYSPTGPIPPPLS